MRISFFFIEIVISTAYLRTLIFHGAVIART